MSFDWAAIPHNVMERILELERRLDDLEGYASLPTVDPEGEGDTIYYNIVQEVDIGEGPGIDVTGAAPTQTVGLGGDSILLYDSAGDPVAEFAASDAGLTAGLAAMAAGDVLELPAVTITGGPWTVAHGTLRGISQDGSVLDGQVTLSDGTALENLSVIRSEDDAGAIYGVVEGAGGITAEMHNVTIDVANATGAAYAVYMENGGEIDAYDTTLLAETGNDGYAVYSSHGDFYHYGGRAIGTVALAPYYY